MSGAAPLLEPIPLAPRRSAQALGCRVTMALKGFLEASALLPVFWVRATTRLVRHCNARLPEGLRLDTAHSSTTIFSTSGALKLIEGCRPNDSSEFVLYMRKPSHCRSKLLADVQNPRERKAGSESTPKADKTLSGADSFAACSFRQSLPACRTRAH